MNQENYGYRISGDYGTCTHGALFFFVIKGLRGELKDSHVTYVLLQSFISSSQRTYIYE